MTVDVQAPPGPGASPAAARRHARRLARAFELQVADRLLGPPIEPGNGLEGFVSAYVEAAMAGPGKERQALWSYLTGLRRARRGDKAAGVHAPGQEASSAARSPGNEAERSGIPESVPILNAIRLAASLAEGPARQPPNGSP